MELDSLNGVQPLFCSFRFFVFLLKKMSPLGEKTSRTVKK